MVKAAGEEHADTNTFQVEVANKFKLLRSAVIYGPNAAGKSNVLEALDVMRDIVRESASKNAAGDELPIVPFKLNPNGMNSPSQFEVTFISEGIRYQYGFAATKERVEEEWLLAYPKGRPQQWFSRAWNQHTQEYSWVVGDSLTGEKQLWRKSTRQNALFLSTAVQLNSKKLEPVYNWFNSTLKIERAKGRSLIFGSVNGWSPRFSASMCEKESTKKQILEFLQAADLDIQDVGIETENYVEDVLPDKNPENIIWPSLVRRIRWLTNPYEINTYHEDSEGDLIPFDFKDESDGTRKLFSFAGQWIDSLENGKVLFVDDLHDNLHPKLVAYLVNLFHGDETNPNNAQLIFTTHETSILNQEVFRRDQIWFCEKGKDKSTSLFPLTDFSPRKGRENLEVAYLAGRYGALPYLKRFELAS